MLDLSIIIVNYKNQHLITQCVQSIVDNEKKISYEILVIDNNSDDNSEYVLKQSYPQLRWFQMGYNSGFGRANNVGIREAKGEFVLLLNSDVVIKSPDTLLKCINVLQSLPNSNNTILGTRLVNPDNSYQETLRLKFPSLKREITANPFYILIVERILKRKINDKKEQHDAHYKSGNVTWINGAFLLMNRTSMLEKKLFFDEDFFLYGEDMEWSWRANKMGMGFYHWHESELIHIGSASMPSNVLKRCQIIVSDWLYFKKTRGQLYLLIVLIINGFTIYTNLLLYAFARLRRKKISDDARKEIQFQYIYHTLLLRYGFKVAFNNKLSTENNFYTNCYEDSFLSEKSK